MSKHFKKLIAPIIITIITVIYLCFIMMVFLFNSVSGGVMLLGVVILLILVLISVYVLMERIKEIRSGEEDDLGKY